MSHHKDCPQDMDMYEHCECELIGLRQDVIGLRKALEKIWVISAAHSAAHSSPHIPHDARVEIETICTDWLAATAHALY